MKRAGYLVEEIIDLKNLYLAYYKAQKGKGEKAAIRDYRQKLEPNLQRLQQEIASGNIAVGDYHYFTIYDPKKRTICAAPFHQRVLHHALMNICHPFFEQKQIFDSYATRSGKGTYAALARAQKFHRRYRWFLKLDFRKYFDSLDHAVLKRQLKQLFKDRALLAIFDQIIDSYETLPGKGVPIGNLTSQYFANHYLAATDHYIKEKLKMKAYVRYMDDLVLWHNDKTKLKAVGEAIKKYTGSHLKLALKPFCLNRSAHGLPFLGYLLYPGQVRLAHRSRFRFIKKLVNYQTLLDKGEWTERDYQEHVLPLIAFTEYANAKAFRKKVIANIE